MIGPTNNQVRTLLFLLLGAIVLGTDSTIGAQVQDENEPEDFFDMSIEELMNIEIVTASKKLERTSDAPATIIVITKQEIRDRGYSNLKDVLRDLPGMEVIEYYQSEMGTIVPVRGVAGNNKIIILVNGMRVNPPGGEEFPIRSDFSVRYAERIEVIYGPGSTLYGQDAINAVINVITKKPNPELSGEAVGIIGTEDHREGYFSLDKDFKTKAGSVKVSTFIQYQDTDLHDFGETYPDWWSAGETVAAQVGEGDPPERWDEGLNALLRMETENASLQLWHRESSRSSSEGGFLPILYYVDKAVWHDESSVIEGRYNLGLSEQCDLESIVTFNRYEIDPETKYVWASSPGTLFYNDDKYGIGTSYSIEEQLQYDFSEEFSLLAGAVASYYDIIPKCTVLGGADPDDDIVSQAGSLSYYTIQGDPTSKVDVPRAHNFTYENYGLYLEGQYDVTKKLRFVAGVRQDFNSRYDEKPISPRLAAIYQPRNNLTAKYIYTEAYVAPSPYVSYMIADNGTSIFVPAPDLEPEEASSHEINLNYNRKNLLISTSLFFNEQQNILLYDEAAPSDGTIWADAAGTQSRNRKHATNSGRSRTQGIDIFTKYNFQTVSLWASYSYVDGDDLPGISDHNARIGATYKIFDRLTTTLSAVFHSTPENITNLAGLGSEIKDPYDLNLHVNYDVNDKTRLFVTVRNLTDNQYALKGVVTPTPQEDIKVTGGLAMRF